jgi:hypothetical protein
VGTSCGAFIVYGRGFQLEHLNREGDKIVSVTAIKPVGVDFSIVCYSDNSIAVFKLPRLSEEDRISGSWLDSPITSLHVDEFTEKNDRSYVYVGTAAGGVYVLEISVDGKIRVVDYSVTLKDAELSGPYAVKAVLSVSFGLVMRGKRYIPTVTWSRAWFVILTTYHTISHLRSYFLRTRSV